ncbi:MAG: PAS domain S-box protein [Leptolyngbyaceae cyanobacterium bins.349]|nr:PAS domain S-box protein [Leptolyngbyaceae cyanobacterium bins.349]
MQQHYRNQWLLPIQKLCQQPWLPLGCGVTATIAILGVWQSVFQEALPARVQATLQQVILVDGLLAAWVLALLVYLGQRSARQAKQTRQINHQLQQEILQRQQIEASLRHNEERWQLALQGNNDGIWDWNVQTHDVFFSSRWKTMLGFEDHEIANHLAEWSNRVHPDDWLRVIEATLAHCANQTPFYVVEYRMQCKDGSYKWILDRGQAIWDEAGNATRMVGSHTDITDRKQTEHALQESEARFRSMADSAPVLIWLSGLDGKCTWFNQTWLNFTGRSLAQELGDGWAEAVHPDDLEQCLETYLTAFGRHQPFEMDYRLRRADGQYRWLLDCGRPRFTPDGEFLGFIGSCQDIHDRKQVETALAQELLRSRTLLQTSIDGIVLLNHQGDVVQTSPSFAEMLGYSVAETLTLNVADWDAQWTPAELADIRAGGVVGPIFETRHRRRDGSIYDVEISYSRVKVDDEFMHFCICRDISDRKRHEAERQQAQALLELSEVRFEALVTNMPGMVYRYYPSTAEMPHHFTFVSAHAHELLELAPDVVMQDANAFVNLIHPADRSSFVSSVSYAVEHFLPWHWQGRITTPSGQLKWIEGNSQAQATAEGAAWDGLLLDISDRKQKEIALHHQTEMFQAIVNHIPVMIALFDGSGQIEFVNPELEKVLGWALADWQQRDVLAQCYPDAGYRQSVIEHMLAATGHWQDMVSVTAFGQRLETSWANVRLSNGSYLGIGQDISDRKHKEIILQQAMEAAEAANLAKSMFLANMSHELRTPLNVILGFAQVMSHDCSLTPGQRSDLQTIQRSGDHLLRLINDILDLAKIEAGHCTYEETSFDLISQLHTLRTMMTERATAKQLQLIFEIAPEVPQFVIADEQKLRQILLNLLSNAIKFTQQGRITLRASVVAQQEGQEAGKSGCRRPGNSGGYLLNSAPQPLTLCFQVIDTGVGIATEEQDSIFDAFVQAEAGRKVVSGTGLGLTISRKLLELMHGTISVQSVPGGGSTFTITLPVCPTSGVDVQPEQQQRLVIGLMPGHRDRRVLIVDDQHENRLLMVRLMARLGLNVREATNGQEAVQIWQDWHPDLTWMDIRMPILDGYEATRQMRAQEQHPSIIIALTAQASQSDRTLALASGCNDYISKPFRAETVFLKMAEHLGFEYVYADADAPMEPAIAATPSTPPHPSPPGKPTPLTVSDLASLPPDWVAAMETAAVCGNDHAIAALVTQLPPALTQFGVSLTELAHQFQFEQILNLLYSSP